ncbi:MAG TPA: carbonic anhydrase family protein [Usitatibacter sp.]|nr:carbonic anhydrase family protein [Usitatibacter sp.]
MNRNHAAAVVFLAASAIAPAAEQHHWGYSGEAAPENWSKLDPAFAACSAGRSQSPVDLPRNAKAESGKIGFAYKQGGKAILNNGHTVQVDYAPGSVLTLDGHAYELKQFHFHAPSENTIDGKRFPMEAHLVHADKDGHLAVVAVMFTDGKASPFVDSLWAAIPAKEGEPKPLAEPLDASGLLPASHRHYRFAGSLTTPPCSEGVTWIVLTQPQSASKAQVAKFSGTLGFANNRPVQPLNARAVVLE